MSASPRTILLVDDDREVQRFLADRLEREGWRVITEKDGDWALRSFERRPVDAVVLDILIPVVNGFQVAERIRATPRGRDVGIVMLTGIYRGPKHRHEAVERYGLLDYLDKPVDVDRLVTLLRNFFAQKHTDSPPPPPKPTPAQALVDDSQKQEKREVERVVRRRPPENAVRGNLRRTPFPRLIAQLHKQRATGGLFLLRDKIKKIVYFWDGHPTFIKSNMLDECLGRVLVRERMITESECEESVRRMKAQRRQQGSVLIEMGVISPHNLRFGLELQLQVKLFDIFDWAEGEYVFRPDVPLAAEVIALDMPCAQIILEGIRRAYQHDRLRSAIEALATHFLLLAEDPERRFQDLELQPAERLFVESLDGSRVGRDLLAHLPPGLDAHGAMSLLHALHCAGILETSTTAARRRAPSSIAFAHAQPSADEGDDARVALFLAERRHADAYAILGVPTSATPEDVERAYAALARDFHPDRFRQRPETTRAMARDAFELLGRAFQDLQDPRKRRQIAGARNSNKNVPGLSSVDLLIEEATNPVNPTQDPAARALAADRIFHRAEALLRSRAFGDAHRLFRQAVELRPDEGKYLAFLGWAVFCSEGQGPRAAEAALPLLERAVELAPRDEHPHLFMGMVLQAIDRPDLAERAFEKAVQSNPDSAEALRELRLLHMRRQKRT